VEHGQWAWGSGLGAGSWKLGARSFRERPGGDGAAGPSSAEWHSTVAPPRSGQEAIWSGVGLESGCFKLGQLARILNFVPRILGQLKKEEPFGPEG